MMNISQSFSYYCDIAGGLGIEAVNAAMGGDEGDAFELARCAVSMALLAMPELREEDKRLTLVPRRQA